MDITGENTRSGRISDTQAGTARTAPSWQRYVAIGDSFTEGMSDPDPHHHDAYVGWADRLAHRMARHNAQFDAQLSYANLAVRGRLIDDVMGPQVDAALAMKPDLVSMVAGGNDIIRPRVDIDRICDRLESAVVKLKSDGADVLLGTMFNPAESSVLSRLRPRISWAVSNLWGIAQRHDCYVLDIWSMRVLQHPHMWAADRLHFSSEGHRRIAQQAAWTLGLPVEENWLHEPPRCHAQTRPSTVRRGRPMGSHSPGPLARTAPARTKLRGWASAEA